MPSVVIFNVEIGEYSVGGFKGLSLVPNEYVRLCLMKDHNFLLLFMLWSSWCGVITDSTYVQ